MISHSDGNQEQGSENTSFQLLLFTSPTSNGDVNITNQLILTANTTDANKQMISSETKSVTLC